MPDVSVLFTTSKGEYRVQSAEELLRGGLYQWQH